MSKLIIIRPGMTESGRAGRMLGRLNEPLLEEERERLSHRAEQGAYPPVGRLYSAPSARARETAAIIYPRMPMVVASDLDAFDCGEFEGMTRRELSRSEAFAGWAASLDMPDCPDGENLNWYAARCVRSIRAIVGEMADFRIDAAALVVHGLAMGLIRQRVCLPRTSYQEQTFPWGGGMVLAFNTAQFTATVTEFL